MVVVDCKGLSCPEPVILTKKALKENKEIQIVVDNRVPMENISRYARAIGVEPVVEEKSGEWLISLKK